MTLVLRDTLEAASSGASPSSDLVARSRQVGQRRLARRRRLTAAGVGAVGAAVVFGSSLTSTWWAQSGQLAGPAASPSSAASPTPLHESTKGAPVTGTAADWLAALARSMPYSDQIKAVRAATNGPAALAESTSVQAVFRVSSGGSATSLVVSAYAGRTKTAGGKSSLETALAACRAGAVSCAPVQQTASGPVLIRQAGERGILDALSFRASGVVVVVRVPDTTTATGSVRAERFTTDQLVNIAALLPEPELADGS